VRLLASGRVFRVPSSTSCEFTYRSGGREYRAEQGWITDAEPIVLFWSSVRQYLVGVATGAGALLLAFMRFVVSAASPAMLSLMTTDFPSDILLCNSIPYPSSTALIRLYAAHRS
jgi:hypothetical protein